MAANNSSAQAFRDIVVVGTSAGGVTALSKILSRLPHDYPGSIFIVQHMPASHKTVLAKLLSRETRLPVTLASDHEPIAPGKIYVAVPDYHLILEDGRVRLWHGPKENRHRPAVDPLFVSAAKEYGNRCVGVVLTGAMDCGTLGLMEIKSRGGVAVVQDPADAEHPSMPASALENVPVDFCLPVEKIPGILDRLCREPLSPPPEPRATTKFVDKPTDITCPECQGPIFEDTSKGGIPRFHCRVGHAFTESALFEGKSFALESALWAAFNSLQEKAEVAQRLAERASRQNHLETTEYYFKQAAIARQHAEQIRRVLLLQPSNAPP